MTEKFKAPQPAQTAAAVADALARAVVLANYSERQALQEAA